MLHRDPDHPQKSDKLFDCPKPYTFQKFHENTATTFWMIMLITNHQINKRKSNTTPLVVVITHVHITNSIIIICYQLHYDLYVYVNFKNTSDRCPLYNPYW